jgi:hypothetical protein
MTTTIKEKIMEIVGKVPVVGMKANDRIYQVKLLQPLHIIVKVHINVHDQGLLNGDVCTVLGEIVDTGELIVERLEDSFRGIVNKIQVSIPEKWVAYPF